MGKAQSIGAERFAIWATVDLDPLSQRPPLSVEAIARRMILVIHRLDVAVQHIALAVGERPRHIAIEPDNDGGNPGNRYSVDVELVRHRQMGLVPDRRQRQLEMWIAGEESVVVCAALGGYRPVVGGVGAEAGETVKGRWSIVDGR